jgi:DNA-binding MarR family transcriptional regulator
MGTTTRLGRARTTPPAEPADPDVVAAVRTLARVARLLERSCTPLTLAQYRVLTRIAAGEDRASRISEQLLVAKPTVSAAIDALVTAGYLDRSADPDDRRAIGLAVTPSGSDALTTAEAAMAARLAPVLAGIEDLDGFCASCDAIETELDARFAARAAAQQAAGDGGPPA